LRSTKVYERWSLASDHDSARLGVVSPLGIGFSMASWIAYITMNGVLNASVSAGSSQRAARVTWRPQRISPGAGLLPWAWTGRASAKKRKPSTRPTDTNPGPEKRERR
jgi:hypothetical protein